MHIKSVNLETICGITSKLPKNDKYEVAFFGKSNVGKSSLINAMINRKSYARTSAQPGKTQTINFYNVNEEVYFVDLPGYGYAKVSQEMRKKWTVMIEKYLKTSEQLKLMFLLIDIRHEPTNNDVEAYNMITRCGFYPIIIATKMDKIGKTQVQKQVNLIRKKLKVVEGTPIIPFSAETKQGRDEVWEYIATMKDAEFIEIEE